ncbi:hypothetical protein AMTRI_Chr02g254230 [Amborella trichopoda]
MDEYQHMEGFSMDNDYDDGQWIGGEFYYKSRKVKRHQTRDDVLFGVFAGSSSEDEGSSKKRRRDGVSKRADLTKPVNFVSTGTVMPSKEIDQNIEENSEERMGLGMEQKDGGLGSGLGFVSDSHGEERGSGLGLGFSHQNKDNGDGDGGDDNFLPTAFGRKIKEGVQRREKEREREREREMSKGKMKSSKVKGEFGDVGEFEKHTKGIGMRLLEKMGYKGGGLGKNAQGIVAPIEAKLRPKNMGMGYNSYEEKSMGLAPLPGLDEKMDVTTTVKPNIRSRDKLWLKLNRSRINKKDYVTADELLAKKQEQGFEMVQKVLDMRGPQVRVLTNLENLNAEETAKENQIPMPELQYNVRLIVDLAEADIQRLDKDLRRERETVVALQREKEKLQEVEAREQKQMDNMEGILGALDKVQEANLAGTLTLDYLSKIFSELQSQYEEDYKLGNLSCIACAFALPLMIRLFQGWQPLLNPLQGVEVMSSWKELLQGNDAIDYGGVYTDSELGVSSPYAQLIREVVLPAIRIAATNSWEPRDPEPMLRFLESWDKLLPPQVLQEILINMVMPKLSAAVDSWDPRRETVPIHAWLHPWLPLLGDKLEPLYHPIQFKLGNVLHAWHASDASAYAILSPWRTVFDPISWERLIVRYIVPKLMSVLQEFQVNPANQNLEQFYWVMSWANAIPIHHMVNLLEVGFFTKWQQVLYHWLCSNPNFEEVTQWYLGWKDLFPKELLANERIRLQLNVGLNMMNQAVEGMVVVQPGVRENISYLRVTEQRQFEAQQQAAAFAQNQGASGVHMDNMGVPEMSLKEAIEAYAQDNNLQFLPKVGRTHDGLQVYGFGNVSVCVDSVKQLIFAQSGDRWVAVSLEQLMEMQRTRRAGAR